MRNKSDKDNATLGILTFLTSVLNNIFLNFSNIFIGRSSLKHSVGRSLKYFLWNSCSKSNYGGRYIEQELHRMKSGETKAIPVEVLPEDEYTAFWIPINSWISIPIFVCEDSTTGSVNIAYIKGTIDLDNLLIEVTKEYYEKIDYYREKCKNASRRFRVVYHMSSKMRRMREAEDPHTFNIHILPQEGSFSNTHFESEGFFVKKVIWDESDLDFSPRESQNPFEFFYITKEAEYLINQVGAWAANKDFYKAHNKPHKKNLLIYGPPGTGKTATIRASAQFFDYPVHVFDLGSLNNDEFARYWAEMVRDSPCFAVFEDLDKVFNGDQNVLNEASDEFVTFNFFLQCLEGMQQVNGIVTFITTNDPECFDKRLALYNSETGEFECRHGRVDEAIHFDYLCQEGKEFLANRLLKEESLIKEVLADPYVNKPITATNFVGFCFKKLASPEDFDLTAELKKRYNVNNLN